MLATSSRGVGAENKPTRLQSSSSRSGACVLSRNLVATTWRALRTTLLAVYSLFHRHVYSAWRSPASESFATRTASHRSVAKRIAMAYSASAIMRPTEAPQHRIDAAWDSCATAGVPIPIESLTPHGSLRSHLKTPLLPNTPRRAPNRNGYIVDLGTRNA
ncbi:hypothetical protein L1887_54663 [Cichorium endivia]|nr:hypothetical protein L1887_54663 [Cichorium endivia]